MQPSNKAEGHYDPALFCDGCQAIHRHYEVGYDIRDYVSYKPDEPTPQSAIGDKFELIIFRCVECGTERGFGSREVPSE